MPLSCVHWDIQQRSSRCSSRAKATCVTLHLQEPRYSGSRALRTQSALGQWGSLAISVADTSARTSEVLSGPALNCNLPVRKIPALYPVSSPQCMQGADRKAGPRSSMAKATGASLHFQEPRCSGSLAPRTQSELGQRGSLAISVTETSARTSEILSGPALNCKLPVRKIPTLHPLSSCQYSGEPHGSEMCIDRFKIFQSTPLMMRQSWPTLIHLSKKSN